MNKLTYRLLSTVILLVLTFGGHISAGASFTPTEVEFAKTETTTNTLRPVAANNSPSVPKLVLPAENVSITNYAPRLDWSTSTLPAGTTFRKYELQLAVNSTFPAPTIVNINGSVTNSEFKLTWNLNPDKKYYWRVRATNTRGEVSAWSLVGTFRTAPLPPILIAPNNGIVLPNNHPTFDWSDVGQTTSYLVQISRNSSFTNLLTNTTMASSSYTPASNLPSNTILYWRVRSKSGNGDSLWSTVQTMTTVNLSVATSTPTQTSLSPTTTSIPPTVTATPTKTTIPPTVTATPTKTSIPPTVTATPTQTSLPPTAASTMTFTPIPTQVQSGNIHYVAKNGNNTNPGTLAQPWLTIQKCLDQVQPGASCEILGGTYNEALVLKNSGTQAGRITLKNYNGQEVIVNSGSSKTIVTGGRIDYYTIDGLKLIASFTPANEADVSIELGINIPFSRTDKTMGNHGFVFRNCYIEGTIHFYGHNNLMENCELNGKNIYQNALLDNFATSYDNVYRNNTIYDYRIRGIWSMESTNNILIEGNTIHNIQHGIDCDGAAISVTNCKVIDNHIYNVGISEWGSGIFLENCFSCLVENNIVHDIQNGAGIYAINYGNGDSIGWHTFNNIEYRSLSSNTRISGNLIYNYITSAGLYVTSVNGLVIDHNTFYTVSTFPAIGLHTESDSTGVSYAPKDETITNNIFFGTGVKWFSPTTGLLSIGNFAGDPGFVSPPADFHLKTNSLGCTAGAEGTYVGAFSCQ